MSVVSPDHQPHSRNQTSETDARFWLSAIADALVGKDVNGVVTSWNKAAEVLFGFTYDEIVGRPVTFIIPPHRIDEEASMAAQLRLGEKSPILRQGASTQGRSSRSRIPQPLTDP